MSENKPVRKWIRCSYCGDRIKNSNQKVPSCNECERIVAWHDIEWVNAHISKMLTHWTTCHLADGILRGKDII